MKDALLASLQPLLAHLATLRADDPAAACAALRGFDLGPVEAQLRAWHATGEATPRQQGPVRFGRLARPSADTRGFSIDIVDMDGSAVGAHTHPSGEFDLSFSLEGSPSFDGRPPGWLVYPPGSRHIPTVTGGRMLIVYFLPDGAIQFEGSP